MIQGLMCPNDYETKQGWYELGSDGKQTLLWHYEPEDWDYENNGDPTFPFGIGFYRNGNIQGFYSSVFGGWGICGHGTMSLDGKLVDYVEDVYETFNQFVFACAYDQNEDKVYAFTIDSSGTGYMFQSINPDTWEFTPIKDGIYLEDVCIAFSYNSADGKMYGVTSEGHFVQVKKDGGLELLKDLDLPTTNATCGMTYSPYDQCFILVHSADSLTYEYLINPVTYEMQLVSELYNVLQYPLLICTDKMKDPQSPRAPILNSVEFDKNSLSGFASVTVPIKNFGDEDLTGEGEMVAECDGVIISRITSLPGETLNMPLEKITEGNHTFQFYYVHGGFDGPRNENKCYVGYDIPQSPTEVVLSENKITWSPVSEGVNAGYIDIENLSYNVYLNDEKLNSEPVSATELEYSIPDVEYTVLVASVEAINHGHASAKTYSNNIAGGNPLELPVALTPTSEEVPLFSGYTTSEYDDSWHYDVYEKSFYVGTYGDRETDWLFLPLVNVPTSEKLIELTFDIKGGSEYPETVSVCLVTDKDVETEIPVESIGCAGYEYESRTCRFASPITGPVYISFKTSRTPEGDGIYLRNFQVSVTEYSTKVPGKCSDIKSIAYPKGGLGASVTLTLPLNNASGEPLNATEPITSNIVSEVGAASAEGYPGDTITLDVETVQGFNDIEVYAESAEGNGLGAKTTVFTGLDIPKPISATTFHESDDNMSAVILWEAPTEGINGGYVNPDEVTYSLYLPDEDGYSWIEKELLDTQRQCEVEAADTERLEWTEYGILTSNSSGNSGILFSNNVLLGKPYSLPMIETFASYDVAYGPVYSEGPDSRYQDCVYMGYIDSINGIEYDGFGIYAYAPDEGDRGRVVLPKFLTGNTPDTFFEFTSLTGAGTPTIDILARPNGQDPIKIGELADDGELCWKTHRFEIPAEVMQYECVAICLDFIFGSRDEETAITSYKIARIYEKDYSVSNGIAALNAVVGTPVELSVLVENSGANTQPVPCLVANIFREDTLLSSVEMESDDEADLPSLGKTLYSGIWTPDGGTTGQIDIIFSIVDEDQFTDNNTCSSSILISKGNIPVVDDLRATRNDDGSVSLEWTEPNIPDGYEGFENFQSFTVLDNYGDFISIDNDGMNHLFFANFHIPYEFEPKAWQIIGTEEVSKIMNEQAGEENTYFIAAEGDRFAVSFAPYYHDASVEFFGEDWLISPELTPNSKFSFQASNLPGYYETISVKVSESPEMEDFIELDALDVRSSRWREYEYMLPEGMKYFAIVSEGNSNSSFILMLDEICYESAALQMDVIGYDIYRDGSLHVENAVSTHAWVDEEAPAEEYITYQIVPVLSRDGQVLRGKFSNIATASPHNNVDNIEIDNIKIAILDDGIFISNGADEIYTINSVEGLRLQGGILNTDSVFIELNTGIYIIRIGSRSYKVMI